MNKAIKLLIIISLVILNGSLTDIYQSKLVAKEADKATKETIKEDNKVNAENLRNFEAKCTVVDPLTLVANPNKYLNQFIKFQARFDKYTTLGLDYKPAFKDSKDYITFLIKRPDIKNEKHTIPLSELKLMLARKTAEKYTNLDTGNDIFVYGHVFSCALNDPWLEVDHLVGVNKDITAPPKTEDDDFDKEGLE